MSATAPSRSATAFASSRPLGPDGAERCPGALSAPLAAGAPAEAPGRGEGRAGRADARAADRRRSVRAPAAGPSRRARRRRADRRGDGDGRRRGSVDLQPAGAPARDAAVGGGDGRRRDRDDEGDVLQPAVARLPLPGRHPADAARQVRVAQPLPGAGTRDHRRGRGCGATIRRSATTRRPTVSPRPRSSLWSATTRRRSPTSRSRCPHGCASIERLPDRGGALAAIHLGSDDGHETARRRLAFEELLLVQLALLRRRRLRSGASARGGLGAAAVAERPLARRAAAVRADRRSAPGVRGDRRRPGADDADAAAADGRGRLRQDGRRAVRAAARGRARLPGRADGADRAAGRAALRDDPGADGGGGDPDRAADGLDPGPSALGPARQAAIRRAVADRRHARADRGARSVSLAGGRGDRRAASVRGAPARGAGRQGRAPGAGRTCCT